MTHFFSPMFDKKIKFSLFAFILALPVVVIAAANWDIAILTKVWKYEQRHQELELYGEFQDLLDEKRDNPSMKIFANASFDNFEGGNNISDTSNDTIDNDSENESADTNEENDSELKENTDNEEVALDEESSDCQTIKDQVAATRIDNSAGHIEGQENFAAEVICLVNEFRTENGLEPYKWNLTLQQLAEAHSEDMGKNIKDISHISSDGKGITERIEASGYNYMAAGENVALGDTSPTEVMESWKNSPLHRGNMLDKDFKEIGVGFYVDEEGSVYWAQVFGAQFE